MPKDTFYNLPDEKRALIEDVAMREFATCGYDKASISRIVDTCGISKGSFYQYFLDKKDLFKLWTTGPMKPITKYGGLPKPTGCV